MIYRIEKSGDYQTDAYEVGQRDVISIEEILSLESSCLRRIKVTISHGFTVEISYHGLTIYRKES